MIKLQISPESLRLAREQLRAKPKTPRRLPGERHEFKELQAPAGARDLVPPQHLDEQGNITSARKHEVQKTDPLLARIKELEAEVKELRQLLSTKQ